MAEPTATDEVPGQPLPGTNAAHRLALDLMRQAMDEDAKRRRN